MARVSEEPGAGEAVGPAARVASGREGDGAGGEGARPALSPALSPRAFDPRLLRLPAVRLSLAASVALGLLSTAAVVAQALGLAHLLASAMASASAASGGREKWFVLLGSGFAVRALVALASEVVAAWGSSVAKAELRSKLVTAAALPLAAHPPYREGPGEGPPGPYGEVGALPPCREGPGNLAALAGPGLDALDVYIGRCLPDFVLAAAAPAALLAAVGVIDWASALIALAVLALFPVFGALVGRASLTLGAERWRRVEELGAYVADVFEGMPVLRAFGRSMAQRERIAKLNAALARSSTKALRVAFLSALVLDELGSLSVALVAVPLGLRLLSGGVSLAAALAVLAVSPEIFAPLRTASAEFHESTEGLAAAARALAAAGSGEASAMRQVLRRRPRQTPAGAVGGRALDKQRPVPDPKAVPVALRSVSVVLPGRATPVLDGASLTLRPGETVALVGPSGSGKSTVISLLAGFLSPSEGAVSAGGVDLRQIDPRRWRRLVTYLPEHPTLLSATLAANLRLAAPAASDEELLSALAQAGAPALAGSLPGGLEARLGEGGRRLSAGELQRVALARVLLRPASLYLLDEPTVHLDEASEQEALAGLKKAIGGSSALIVSHRPAVTLVADRVVSLRGGRLVDVAKDDVLTPVPA